MELRERKKRGWWLSQGQRGKQSSSKLGPAGRAWGRGKSLEGWIFCSFSQGKCKDAQDILLTAKPLPETEGWQEAMERTCLTCPTRLLWAFSVETASAAQRQGCRTARPPGLVGESRLSFGIKFHPQIYSQLCTSKHSVVWIAWALQRG